MKNKKYIPFIISAVILLAGILSTVIQGLNLGIDFRGGTLLTAEFGQTVIDTEITQLVSEAGGKDVRFQLSGDETLIRFYCDDSQDISELRSAITEKLTEKYETDTNKIKLNYATVSPTASKELVIAAVLTVSLATVCMLVYIWFRFKLSFGIAAVLGLLHDILITLSVVSLLHIQLNSTFIAAMLTIVGYTINNTIVVFDRIRENDVKYDIKKYDRQFVVTTSVKESFKRTLFSSLTTLFTIGALCILGVTSVQEFALPIIVGILSSMYSCILINPTVWEILTNKIKDKKPVAKNA